MASFQPEQLKRYAAKYIKWESPDIALRCPQRVVAQVMDIGNWDDVIAIEHLVGRDYMRDVIANADFYQFDVKSWHFWHYRLGLSDVGEVPPLPVERFISNPVIGSRRRVGISIIG